MLMKKYMMYEIALLWIVLITCFHASAINPVAAMKPPIAKPGCVDICGNVEIPFPFGIGSSNCYVDEWFEIVCNMSTTPHKPFLRRSNWEVLNISINGDFTIQVWSPISYWNCTGKTSTITSGGLNLTGKPFFFASNDVLTVVGCGARGFMLDYSNNNSKIVAGCSSICSVNDIYWCTSPIPTLSSYQVGFQTISSFGKRDCKIASFVADFNWVSSKLQSSLDHIYDMDHVPVTLYWYLYHSDFDLFGANVTNNSSNWTNSMACSRNTAPSPSSVNETTLECNCLTGFHGNPFLFEGCLDINECEEYPAQVCGNDNCINHYGSYECKDRPSNHIKSLLVGALAYLHSEASSPIYHRDIKSANILLDDKYRAKIADFGTSRLVDIDQTHVTTQVCGTFGYLDPQYYRLCQYTEKSDVYSFGVLMVELLTRQKPVFKIKSSGKVVEEHQNLRDYIECMKEDRLCDIIDPKIMDEVEKIEDVIEVAILAKGCLDLDGSNRPTMKKVSIQLEEIMKSSSKSSTSTSFNPQSSTIGTQHVSVYSDSSSSSSFIS